MKKTLIFISLILLAELSMAQMKTFHDFRVRSITGEEFDLATLKGKKVLVVNTASECGYTPQYHDLQELFQEYGGDYFTIIGFPANNFGAQEPGNDEQIREFCTQNYGVTFPMMSKISVKGDDIAPVYDWLTRKSANGVQDAEVTWNFQKFMIDENGNWVGTVPPKNSPDSKKIVEWIKQQ